MSGPICPACGCPSLLGELTSVTCAYCDWMGDVSHAPYKRLMPEAYKEWDEKLEARTKGRILTIRFDVTADAVGAIMAALKVNSFSHRDGVSRIVRKRKPSASLLAALRKIPGMIEVTT